MATKTIMCPNCKTKMTIEGSPGEKKVITCSKCNTKGKFTFTPEKAEAFVRSERATIEVRNLSKSFNGIKAVNNVSFDVREGEIFGFLGPNGAGKTTTMKAILNLIRADYGKIKINGVDAIKDVKNAHRYIGYLPEKVAFYGNLTALQNMYFYAEMKKAPKEQCLPLIREMGLGDALNKKVGKFSKGMQQRLGMAQALLGNPKILILDEPSGGLDPRGVALIRDKIVEMKEKGATIFLSSHILAEVQGVCDRVGILHKGAIVAQDTVPKLREKLKLKPKLVLELEKISDGVLEAIKAVDGVESVKAIGVMVHVVCDPETKSKIIVAAEKAGGNIINIQTMDPSLEEVFMRFTEDA